MDPKKKRKRYKNQKFLNALGWQCRTLRILNDMSIADVVAQSDMLSAGTIDRLERGLADIQISVLMRYAKVMGLTVSELLNFPEAN